MLGGKDTEEISEKEGRAAGLERESTDQSSGNQNHSRYFREQGIECRHRELAL